MLAFERHGDENRMSNNLPEHSEKSSGIDTSYLPARPRGYEDIKALAKLCGCNIPDLIVLARNNDPFFCGTLAHRRDAEWFVWCWNKLGYTGRTGVHLRAIHYRLVSQDPPPVMPDGSPYLNTLECWSYLGCASKTARHLRMVDVEAFEDHRNPRPLIYADPLEETDPALVANHWFEWALPEIRADLSDDFFLSLPRFTATGYGYDPALQPYLLEIWIEKSTMNSVLLPVCRKYNINLVTSIGFQSIPSAIALLRRAEIHGKPARVFYISDFDPAGSFMPDAVARQIEFWGVVLGIDADVKLHPLALTSEQVTRYELPSIPIKESDRRKAGFESRYGMEATELDALEALRPGELARLVENAVLPYRDQELQRRWLDAEEEANRIATDAAEWVARDVRDEWQAIQSEVCAILESYRERIVALNTDLQQELNPYRPRIEVVRQAIQDRIDEVEEVFELPEQPEPDLPEPDEADWLFDSGRDYLTQLAFYKARRASTFEAHP